MVVLVTAEVKGQTQQGYDGTLNAVQEFIKKAPGFISHFSHPVDGGWRVIEIWKSKADADHWYGKYVVPNLPPGIAPKRSYQELHSLVTL